MEREEGNRIGTYRLHPGYHLYEIVNISSMGNLVSMSVDIYIYINAAPGCFLRGSRRETSFNGQQGASLQAFSPPPPFRD